MLCFKPRTLNRYSAKFIYEITMILSQIDGLYVCYIINTNTNKMFFAL